MNYAKCPIILYYRLIQKSLRFIVILKWSTWCNNVLWHNNWILPMRYLVFDEYQKIAEKSIEDSIKSELSGDFERLMLAVGTYWLHNAWPSLKSKDLLNSKIWSFLHPSVQCIRSKAMFFAKRLYKSMKVNVAVMFPVTINPNGVKVQCWFVCFSILISAGSGHGR